MYNCWKLFSSSVIKNKTLPIVQSRINIIGRNLYFVTQKALRTEIKNRVINEAYDSPKLLKKNSIITKKIKDKVMSFIYFFIFIYCLKLFWCIEIFKIYLIICSIIYNTAYQYALCMCRKFSLWLFLILSSRLRTFSKYLVLKYLLFQIQFQILQVW